MKSNYFYLYQIINYKFLKIVLFVILFLILYFCNCEKALSQIAPGKITPNFSLINIYGEKIDSSMKKKNIMIILYFFDVESPASQNGLLFLNKMSKAFEKFDIAIWGITSSNKNLVEKFKNKN